jgi:hypothetical protein
MVVPFVMTSPRAPPTSCAKQRPMRERPVRRPRIAARGATRLAAAVSIITPVVAVEPRLSWAETAQNDQIIDELRLTVDELKEALGKRDELIAEMLRRMDELERRLVPVGLPAQAPQPAPPKPPISAEQGADTGGAGDAVATSQAAPSPSPGPGRVEIDEEAVASALERALIQEGALLLPAGTIQVQPSFTFTRREPNRLNFEVQDGEQVVSVSQIRQDIFAAGIGLRAGLPLDSQLALDVPYRYQETDIVTGGFTELSEEQQNAAGFGDVRLALSKGVLRERDWWPDLIARVAWDTDSGQTDHGVSLGSGFDEVTAGIRASKSQDPLVFVAGLSYTYAFEDSGVQPGDAVDLELGTVLAVSPETSLRFFLNQSFIGNTEVAGSEVPGSDRTVGLFRIGAALTVTAKTLLDIELGIGLSDGAPDYVLGASVPMIFDLPLLF